MQSLLRFTVQGDHQLAGFLKIFTAGLEEGLQKKTLSILLRYFATTLKKKTFHFDLFDTVPQSEISQEKTERSLKN